MILTAFVHARNNIRENLPATLAGVITTSFSLVILGTFLLVYLNLIHLTDIVFHQGNYSIFLENGIDDDNRDAILAHLKSIRGIGEIRRITAEEARKQLIESFGEAREMLENLDFPKLPDIIEFALDRSNALPTHELEKIRFLPGVAELVSGRETQDQINTFFGIAEFVGVFLIVLLVVSIVLIIHNSIQVAIKTRSKEIEILKILGATSGFVRSPYIIEGVLIAVTSFLVSIATIYFLFKFVVAGITFNEATYSLGEIVRFFSAAEMGDILLLLVFSGLLSSILATNKILDQLET